jgi:hypothetical protein
MIDYRARRRHQRYGPRGNTQRHAFQQRAFPGGAMSGGLCVTLRATKRLRDASSQPVSAAQVLWRLPITLDAA